MINKKYDYDFIIIGGGSAGLSTAYATSQLGAKTLLISQEMLGGDCLHHGCVPSKSLLATAKLNSQIKSTKKHGIEVGKTEVNWNLVKDRIKSIQSTIQKHDSPERFTKLGCDVFFGKARFLTTHTIKIKPNKDLEKRQTKLFNKNVYSGRKIIIATGSHPFIPNIPGLSETNFLTNENIFDIDKLPERIIIIGAGVVAIEMASAFANLGSHVSIISRSGKPLESIDSDVSEFVTKHLKSLGVDIYTDTEISKIVPKEEFKQVYLDSKHEPLEADEILVATGRAPNHNLDLEKASVNYTRRGVTVDKKLRTNHKHILAIGDVNGKSLYTHTANYEASLVVANEVLNIPIKQKTNYNKIGWAIYTSPEIASIGKTEIECNKNKVNCKTLFLDLSKQDRSLSQSSKEGFIKVVISKRGHILGCQIVSSRAGEMIREWQLAMDNNIKISKIAKSTFIYPTYGQANKSVAASHYTDKLFNKNVRKILSVLFGYKGG